MKLYRVSRSGEPYTGPGSFWAASPEEAQKGIDQRGGQVWYGELAGEVFEVDSDEHLIRALTKLGAPEAEDRVYDADWHNDERTLEALRKAGVDWVKRPNETGAGSRFIEYVRIANDPLPVEQLGREESFRSAVESLFFLSYNRA